MDASEDICSRPLVSIGALRKCVGASSSGLPKRMRQMPGATDSTWGVAETGSAARMLIVPGRNAAKQSGRIIARVRPRKRLDIFIKKVTSIHKFPLNLLERFIFGFGQFEEDENKSQDADY